MRALAIALVPLVALVFAASGATASASAGQRLIRSPLIGSWEETFTRTEYIAAGADPEEQAQPENWGHFLLTFHKDGRFVLAKLDRPTYRTGGTFRLRGARVTLTCRCDPYPNWPYSWSVFRGTLTFQRARPNNSDGSVNEPTGFVVKPWKRKR